MTTLGGPRCVEKMTLSTRSERLLGGFGNGTLLISAPGQKVDDEAGAGRVYTVDADEFNDGGFWSQDGPAFPMGPAPGNAFGTSIGVNRRGGLVISAPGESVNGNDGAGAIYATSTGLEWTRIHQDRRGVSTGAEVADGFGDSLAS